MANRSPDVQLAEYLAKYSPEVRAVADSSLEDDARAPPWRR